MALTCRHFAARVDSHTLLADVQVQSMPGNLASRMHSFHRGLVLRGAHVRRLRFKLRGRRYDQPRDEVAEALACVAACVLACPNLEELHLETRFLELPLGDWVAASPSLRRLIVQGLEGSTIRLLASLETLTALEDLTVGEWWVAVAAWNGCIGPAQPLQ